ncbi:hypothetical protein AAE478_008661 [Parahypoxylon ruwenzoriense]
MKHTLSLVALAAGLSQVTATGFGFHNAPKFSCPDNTDNVCIPDITAGLDWTDLPYGGFDSYKGFKWSGFTCADKFGKRDELTARTFQSKCITGKATKDKSQSPKISCDKTKGVNKTSIKKFQVSPEFDCDLEFHYTMPDGSSCKHRSACKASGTTVENTQCGGATDVTVVYPEQPKKPKSTCDFGIHHIDFDCEGPKPNKPSPSYPASTPSNAVSSPSASSPATTSSIPIGSSTGSFPAETLSYSASVPILSTASSSASVPAESSSVPGESTTSSAAAVTSSYPASSGSIVETTSSAVEITSSAVVATSSVVEATSSTAAVPTTSSEAVSSFSVTSYLTTSTVFTTSIQTITSCGPTVTDCPAGSTALTTVTIPLSTTICPVTETIGVSTPASQPTESVSSPAGSPSQPAESTPAGSSATLPAESTPAGSSATLPAQSTPAGSSASVPAESTPAGSSATVPAESTPAGSSATLVASSTSSAPAGPVETLPCPGVVPSCLNTWMFSVGCKDNTDSACYCPDAAFVKNIFTCLYAHGESDEIISEAISYFQGICAPFAPTNPGIATGAETITTILTASPTAPPAAVTTIEIATTVVVPCTDEAGETIPNSSSTVTINTSLTVPGVIFTTVTSGPSSTDVGVVPGTYSATATAPVAIPTLDTATATATATATPVGGAPLYPTNDASTTFFTAPAGTGGVYPTSSTTAIVTAGAAHVGAGMGLLGFAGMVIAAAL